jgi:hypothetical protein
MPDWVGGRQAGLKGVEAEEGGGWGGTAEAAATAVGLREEEIRGRVTCEEKEDVTPVGTGRVNQVHQNIVY